MEEVAASLNVQEYLFMSYFKIFVTVLPYQITCTCWWGIKYTCFYKPSVCLGQSQYTSGFSYFSLMLEIAESTKMLVHKGSFGIWTSHALSVQDICLTRDMIHFQYSYLLLIICVFSCLYWQVFFLFSSPKICLIYV